MKMWAKFDETTPCNKRQLTYLRRDTTAKLTNKVARLVNSKSIIFLFFERQYNPQILMKH